MKTQEIAHAKVLPEKFTMLTASSAAMPLALGATCLWTEKRILIINEVELAYVNSR